MNRFRLVNCLMATFVALLLHGCQSMPSATVKGAASPSKYPGRELDYIARNLDTFGSMTIGGATLIEPDPRFQFDLDLSAEEIFKRNRLEGFSTIHQQQHVDAQLSLRAEMIQGMIQESDATMSPDLRGQVAQKLQAAAFRELLKEIPGGEALAEQLAASGDPNASQKPGSFQGDAGESLLATANAAAQKGDAVLAKLAQRVTEVGALSDGDITDAGKLLVAAYRDEGAQAFVHLLEAIANGGKAADEVLRLVAHVDGTIGSAPSNVAGNLQPLTTLTTKAAEGARLAKTALSALNTTVTGIRDNFTNNLLKAEVKTTADAKANVGSVNDEAKKAWASTGAAGDKTLTVQAALAAVKTAIDDAKAAANAVGVPMTPILTADPIKKEDRLALGRLQSGQLPFLVDPKSELALNLRQLLLLTASDKMTHEMLRWLSYPEGFGPGKRVYLCMTNVSCTPGTRTATNFRGQIDLTVSLGRLQRRDGNDEFRELETTPLVFSVYPFLDSQVLDLRSSRRQSFTAALQLVLTGYPQAARGLLDLATAEDQNTETITGFNTLTGYSSGNQVGFTFSPRFRAQSNPANIRTRPGWHLDPQSFPAIVMIIVDERDLITSDPDNGANTLVWRQSYRWMPIDKKNFGYVGSPAFSETALGKAAAYLDTAEARFKSNWNTEINVPADIQTETLRKRFNYFKGMVVGNDVYMSLPVFSPDLDYDCGDFVMKIQPETLWEDSETTLYVELPKGYKGPTDVTVAGRPANSVRLSSTQLRVTVPALGNIERKETTSKTRVPIVVSNGHCILSANLNLERLLIPAQPKPPAAPPAPAPPTADTGKPQIDILGERVKTMSVGTEHRFEFRLKKPLLDSAGKAVEVGNLYFNAPELAPTPTPGGGYTGLSDVKVAATVFDTGKITQDSALARSATGFTPPALGGLVGIQNVEVYFGYNDSRDNALKLIKVEGSVEFLR